jgi:hypothetical protein
MRIRHQNMMPTIDRIYSAGVGDVACERQS